MNNSQNIAQNQGIYDRDHRNGAVSPQNAHKESLPSNISIRVGSPNESSRFPSKLFEDSVELKIEDYENYIFDSLEEILIEMISSCLLTKGTQRKHYFFNWFFTKAIAANLGEVAIDGPNMKGLILSVMIGKFGKLMESIKTQNFRDFL